MPKDNKPSARTTAPTASNSKRDFLTALIEADKRSRSWREKLAAVQELLANQLSNTQPDSQEAADHVLRNLVDVAIYARFLAAGQVRCEEDGRHFRPGHHSRIAQNIQEQLARYSNPRFKFVTRQIYPWLPSADQRFQSAEPLTRIRDIAHRNDIPSELKREIKETLQNKLHRCAGPEDLVTSSRLLKRITAPGASFSAEFVEQFRIFHRELEEFFNAGSLEDQLQVLREAAPAQAQAVDQFLKQKSRGAGAIGDAEDCVPTAALDTLRSLTDLRRGIQGELQSKSPAERQPVQLADIRLEEFAFVLLSQIANELEDAFKEKPERSTWEKSLAALQCGVINAGLGGVSPQECMIIENELRAWSQSFDSTGHEDCLRLKATVERAQRLSETFADEVMALFPREAERLGRALGVAEPAVRVFGEAEIRRHVVFQLSKLSSLLIRQLRGLLGDSGWEILVGGDATGRLQVIDSFEHLRKSGAEPALVLLKEAQGDEELPEEVAGVVLAHEIPHLSHLGVRARQAGVVFVTCEVPDVLESLRQMDGRSLTLTVAADEVRWTEENLAAAQSAKKPATQPAAVTRKERALVTTNGEGSLLELSQATPETAGPKAFGARRLMEISRDSSALFKALDGAVIPFGAMDQALEANSALKREYEQAIGGLESANDDEFDGMVEQLGRLVSGLTVPERFISGLATKFDTKTGLMARSSSNCEDMETSAGAGLYESVPNVPLDKIESAVRQVWRSLWTQRAARDRKRAGVPQTEARMAVLLQPMLTPKYSFVIHTANPVNGDRQQVYIELAVGLGETLVSAANHGSPYRFVYEKESGASRSLAFANLSQALYPSAGGGIEKGLVDYSQCELSIDPDARAKLVKRLGKAAQIVETAFNRPMDIEGAIVGREIYFVQARPQQGLGNVSAPSRSVAKPHADQRARRTATEAPTAEPAEVAAARASQASPPALPCKVLGLFEKRIAGDDSLLQLARLRFEQAELAPEVHAGSPEQLDWMLSFIPGSGSRPIVHLPRDFNFADLQTRAKIRELASRFNGRIDGLLLHDRGEWARQPEAFVQASQDMESMLARDKSEPLVFVEYAAGLEPAEFVGLFEKIRDLGRVTASVDVGHIGTQSIRVAHQKMHAGEDVCRLKDRPAELPALMPDLECAVAAALPSVVSLVTALGTLGKPLHFHLHDGHPLSKASPFGVADHLSFKSEIPLDFEHHGRRSIAPMYGPAGLNKIIATALGALPSGSLSFTLEIHPTNERRALADADHLFSHWRDKTNAEIMNHWLWVLAENAKLLREALKLAVVKH